MKVIKRLSALISPQSPLAGLEISDSTVRLVDGRDSSKQASLHLSPGIIEGGQLKNREEFKAALRELYRRFPSKIKRHLNVVLAIPANDVFIQTRLVGFQIACVFPGHPAIAGFGQR